MTISQTLHSFLNCAKSVQRAHINPISSNQIVLLVFCVLRASSQAQLAPALFRHVTSVLLARSPQQALVHVRGVLRASSQAQPAPPLVRHVTTVLLARSHQALPRRVSDVELAIIKMKRANQRARIAQTHCTHLKHTQHILMLVNVQLECNNLHQEYARVWSVHREHTRGRPETSPAIHVVIFPPRLVLVV